MPSIPKVSWVIFMLLLIKPLTSRTTKKPVTTKKPGTPATTYRTIICDNVILVLLCPNFGQLHIGTADYGRWNKTICPDKNYLPADDFIGCRTGAAAQSVVVNACNGRSTCTIQASVRFMNNNIDPCSGTYKYVNMTYTCLPPKKKQITIINKPKTKTVSKVP